MLHGQLGMARVTEMFFRRQQPDWLTVGPCFTFEGVGLKIRGSLVLSREIAEPIGQRELGLPESEYSWTGFPQVTSISMGVA